MIDSAQPYILVFGISICDIFGFTQKAYKAYDSNPGKVKMSYGGVCRNIAENMARIGMDTKFISILGDDDRGKGMMAYANQIGLDMSHSYIVENGSTPTYIAILDENGEMVSAVVDMDIINHLTEAFMDSKKAIIEGSDYMVFGADNPEILEYVIKQNQGKTRFILDPVSAAKSHGIKHLLPYCHTIKPNRHEAEVLCGFALESEADLRRAGEYFRELGIENIFISLDEEGIYYSNQQGEGILCAQGAKVVNVTGAGDSFVAGITHGYMNGLDIKDTVKFAITMSYITISHEETIHPQMGYDYVVERMQSITWKETVYR